MNPFNPNGSPFPPAPAPQAPQAPQGFGAPQAPQGFGAPQAPQGFGAPQAPQGFGAPQAPQGFGGAPAGGFGAPQMPFNPFQGTGDAETYSRLPNLTPGCAYQLHITGGSVEQTRDKTQLLLIEYEIEQSNDPQLPAGSKAKRFIGFNDSFAGNWKRICFAAHGARLGDPESEAQISPHCDAMGQELVSGNPPSGISVVGKPFIVRVTRQPKKGKDANSPNPDDFWTAHDESPL